MNNLYKNIFLIGCLSLLVVGEAWGQGNLFWGGLGKIIRANANGQNKTTILESKVQVADKIALDVAGNKLYWSVVTDDFSKIQRSNLDGTGVLDLITADAFTDITGIALAKSAGKIYWSETNYETDISKIKRANLDGSAIETVLTLATDERINDITLDLTSNKMYWYNNQKIQRANLNGTTVETIVTSANFISTIALSSTLGKVYWFEYNGAIRRANLNGTSQEDIVTGFTSGSSVRAIDLNTNTGKMYWGVNFSGVAGNNENKIQVANLDGTSKESLLISNEVYGIATDHNNSKIYWSSVGIKRADLNGSNEITLVPPFAGEIVLPSGMAIDLSKGKVYLFNITIQRMNLDGTSLENLITTNLGGEDGDYDDGGGQIALDIPSNKMYWVTDSLIERANMDGSNRQTLIAANASTSIAGSLALDLPRKMMYWLSYAEGVNNWSIQRASMEGNTIQTIINLGNVSEASLALDTVAQKIYWAEGNLIKRANFNGSQIQTVYDGGSAIYVDYMVVDKVANKLYWAGYDENVGNQVIRRANLDGSSIENIISSDIGVGYMTAFAIANCPPLQVNIQANKPTNICVGESVTFIASAGGTNPQYKWYVNNTLVSTTSTPTFTTNLLQNNDVVKVVLTRTDACAGSATSNTINFTVNPIVTPSVSISIEGGATCIGKTSKFTANAVNGGTNPQYQWYLNGNKVGANSPIFESNTLKNGDKLWVALTSNSNTPCLNPFAQSDVYNINLTSTLTSSVNISANISSGQAVCNGDFVTFMADGTNEGGNPKFIWVINSVIKDTTSTPNYTTNAFTNNGVNVVSVRLLSSYPCLSNANPISSANFSFNTRNQVTPSLSLQALSGTTICKNEVASFKANPDGGGVEPLFQWYINNIPQGNFTRDDVFNNLNIKNNDTVSVQMLSRLTCAAPQTIRSNAIIMKVNEAPIVEISTANGNTVCQGTNITFTANPQNASTSPSYQWRKNGTFITGATNNTYTINSIGTLDNNANIDVIMTTNVSCNQKIVASNPINIIVIGAITPNVSIKARQGAQQCAGSEMIFEVDQVNLADPSATYIWKVNGTAVANSNASVFNAGVLQAGNTVQLEYTTTLGCANPKKATSNSLTINTQSLLAPEKLGVSAVGTGQINLNWEDKSSSETRFVIERATGEPQGFQVHNFVLANQTTFIDGVGLLPNTTYYYRVRAANDNVSGCVSAYSTIVGATTDSGDLVTGVGKGVEQIIRAYPNPSANGVFRVRGFGDYVGKVEVSVINLLQQAVYQQNWEKDAQSEDFNLDLSTQSSGIYYLQLKINNRTSVVKLIKN
jgi:hypothetical protein